MVQGTNTSSPRSPKAGPCQPQSIPGALNSAHQHCLQRRQVHYSRCHSANRNLLRTRQSQPKGVRVLALPVVSVIYLCFIRAFHNASDDSGPSHGRCTGLERPDWLLHPSPTYTISMLLFDISRIRYGAPVCISDHRDTNNLTIFSDVRSSFAAAAQPSQPHF